MATASVLSPHKRRIFTSVFPTQARTTPTPEVSPYIGAPPSPIVSQSNESISIADQIAQRSVAWSLVTRWLSVSTSLQAPRPAPPGLDDALVTLIQAGVVVQGQSYRDLVSLRERNWDDMMADSRSLDGLLMMRGHTSMHELSRHWTSCGSRLDSDQ